MSETVLSGADRTLFLLATLARAGKPLSIAQLTVETGLAISTVYRQVALLKRWGFVAEQNGEYAPGPVSLQLAAGFDSTQRLVSEARPEMERLARESKESVGLVVAVRGQVVCLDMVESLQPLRCSFERGRGVPLLRGASAKSLLAFMPAMQRETLLNELLAAQPDLQSALFVELEALRAQGYVTSSGEVDEGVWGVSVPLYGPQDRAVGSLSLMAPSLRAQLQQQSLINQTIVAANRINSRLQSF
jgi:DNA-binding IclR family transcriptional regulator